MSDENRQCRYEIDIVRDYERRTKAFLAALKGESDVAGLDPWALGKVARLMEEAFVAGFHAGRSPSRGKPWITAERDMHVNERDFGRMARALVSRLRFALFGSVGIEDWPLPPRPQDIAMVLVPAEKAPRKYGNPTWVLPAVPKEAAGTRGAEILRRAGMLETMPLGDGWSVAWLTEWGYELVKHGRTALPERRVPGGSLSWVEWESLVSSGPHPALRAVKALGLLEQVAAAWPIPMEKDLNAYLALMKGQGNSGPMV